MSYRFTASIALSILTFAVAGCRQQHEAYVDRLFSDYTGDVPGASVMIIRDGRPLFTKAYGLAELESGTLITTETNFRLASVTKQFTAMAIMILAERERLGFDTTLTEIFPDFPAYGTGITIRHLLQHTSGLIAYESLIPETATEQVLDRDVLGMMAAQDSTYFEPGSAYRYSNSGYAMLAMVVETVSGQSFPEFLADYIFGPLGMDSSIAYVNGINDTPNRSYGFSPGNGAFEFSDQSLTSAVLGDGGVYSSVTDLFKWDQALYTETLVSKETLKRAFTAGTLSNGEPIAYGFGWNVGKYREHRCLWHGGSTCGFRTAIHRYPDDNFTVIILANRSIAETDKLAERLTDVFLFAEECED